MTPRTLWAVREEWLGFVLLFVGTAAILVGALYWLSGCAAAENDAAMAAKAINPILAEGCVVIEAVDNKPWVDFACAGAESVANILQHIPEGKVVGTARQVMTDGSANTLSLVRVPFPNPLDAGPAE